MVLGFWGLGSGILGFWGVWGFGVFGFLGFGIWRVCGFGGFEGLGVLGSRGFRVYGLEFGLIRGFRILAWVWGFLGFGVQGALTLNPLNPKP